MFNNSKISGISRKFGQVAQYARSKTVLAAAVAATTIGLSASSFGAINDITAFTSQTTVGTSTTITNVAGYGASYSPFKTTNTYTMHYLGEDQAIKSVTAGALGTFNVSGLGTAVFRNASSGANNTTIWYQGTGTGANHSTVTLDGPLVTSFAQAFNGNNLMMGGDNVFSNTGNAVGNNTNIDRIDLLFTGGIKASSSSAFSIFDRGPSNDHDSFKIAAITSLSGGNPSSYGPLRSYADGTWGNTALLNTTQEDITRKNNALVNDTLHPSDSTAQAIGGVLIQTSTLVPTGTTIYGYSLFSGAVAQGTSSAALVNYTDLPIADSTSSGGGLDPTATLGALYTSSVPEPTTAALALAGIGGLIARRPKRKLV